MDPLDFLEVARSLSGANGESEWRTSVGRSYFAVFNQARLRVEPLKALPGDHEAHRALVYYLTSAPNRDLSSVGQYLKDLRMSRNEADYDMQTAVSDQYSRVALGKADRAVTALAGVTDGALRAALAALATYRSGQPIH